MSIKKVFTLLLAVSITSVWPAGNFAARAANCPGGEISSGDVYDPTETPPATPSPILMVPREALNFVDTTKDVHAPSAKVSFQRIGKVTLSDGKSYHLFTSPYEYLLNNGSTSYGFIRPGSALYNTTMPREKILQVAQANGSTSGVDLGSNGVIFLSLLRGGVALAGGVPIIGWGAVAISLSVQRIQDIPISLYELSVISKSVYGFYLFLPDSAISGSDSQITANIQLMQTYRDFEKPTSTDLNDIAYEKILAFISPSQEGVQVGTKFSYPDTNSIKNASCDIKLSTEMTSQVKTTYSSWVGSDVQANQAVEPATSQEDVSVCGKPTLKNIINFALCSVLDALLSFLKSLI